MTVTMVLKSSVTASSPLMRSVNFIRATLGLPLVALIGEPRGAGSQFMKLTEICVIIALSNSREPH